MTVAARRSSIVARSSAARRFAVVERLRRALFSPSKLLTVGALALALSAQSAFAQGTSPLYEIGCLSEKNYKLSDTQHILDLRYAYYGNRISFSNATIELNGQTIALDPKFTVGPIYDPDTSTLYQWSLQKVADNDIDNLADEEAKTLYAQQTAEYFKNKYKELGIDIEEKYAKGEKISKIVTVTGHYLDISAGGVVFVEESDDVTASEILISPQTVSGKFIKMGAGGLNITNENMKYSYTDPDKKLEHETTYGGKTTFNGDLRVCGGLLRINGDGEYNGTVEVSPLSNELVQYDAYNDKLVKYLDAYLVGRGQTTPELCVSDGKHVFNNDITVMNGIIDLVARASKKEEITVNEDLTLTCNSNLWSCGSITYNGTLAICNYDVFTDDDGKENYQVGTDMTYAVFTNNFGGMSNGNTVFGDKSKLIIDSIGSLYYNTNESTPDFHPTSEAPTTVFANANCLDVDVDLRRYGSLIYTNVSREAKDNPAFNKFFITLDEAQTPTRLKWNAGSENITQAIANGNIVKKNITSASPNASLSVATLGSQVVDQTGIVNGYTVVFNNAEDKEFNHAGMTTVYSGFMVVQGDTNFGAFNKSGDGISTINIWGESYDKVGENPILDANGDEVGKAITWQVNGCGMIGFDRNGAAQAPSITADSVIFHNGVKNTNDTIIGGSRIWINAKQTGELGAINAQAILFGDKTQIWYDNISSHKSEDRMTFALNAPEIHYNDTDVNNYDPKKVTTVGEIEDLFGRAVLVDAKYELAAAPANGATALTEEGRRAQTATAGTVTVTAKNVGQYAESQNMSAKERELAGKIDEARVQGGRSTGFYDALYNETDERNVRQTIHNLSLLGYTMLNSQGHFGNPTSSFFGGASISGEAKRGQERQEDWETEENQPEQKSEIAKEQNDYNPTRGLWAAYTHTSVDGEDYKFGGVTTHGYKLRRDGIIGGIRRQIDATTSAGLFFGISMPEVASSARLDAGNQIAGNGYGVVSSSMEMTDFQYAVHFEKVFADAWELAAYVGGGTQAMEWERRADLRDSHSGIYKYKADGSGSTFTGTLYLSYRADVNDALTLRPTIGVDTEHSWLYGFEEKGGLEGSNPGNVALNPYTDMFAQAYRYKKTYYARNTARVGLSLAYSNPRNDMLGANARVFYGVKLGGDDAPELTYYNENYRWENMASHEMGDGSLNVGGGGFMHLNPIKTLTATGDVNAIWYKNAQTFNVTGGVSYRF